MKKSKNEKVRKFLDDLILINNDKFKILSEIRQLILTTYPKAEEKIMYGGIIFFLNTEMFSGVFANKNHVSLEFSKGYQMKDPDKLLEGKGKYRRHLKIKDQEGVSNKKVAYFVKQAI